MMQLVILLNHEFSTSTFQYFTASRLCLKKFISLTLVFASNQHARALCYEVHSSPLTSPSSLSFKYSITHCLTALSYGGRSLALKAYALFCISFSSSLSLHVTKPSHYAVFHHLHYTKPHIFLTGHDIPSTYTFATHQSLDSHHRHPSGNSFLLFKPYIIDFYSCV